jgi:hypothetical protein
VRLTAASRAAELRARLADLIVPDSVLRGGESLAIVARRFGSVVTVELAVICTVGLSTDIVKMRVNTYDIAGKQAQRPFHLAVFRDPTAVSGRSHLTGHKKFLV